MRGITIESSEDGLHPSELIVTLLTADGSKEEVAVDRRQVRDNVLKAYEVGTDGGRVLVELPRETFRGAWRLWMPAESVVDTTPAVA